MQPQALFRLVFKTSGWLRDHLTRTGIGMALLTAFSGALGLNTEVNFAHQIFSLGISFLAMDAIAAYFVKRRLPAFKGSRRLPALMNDGAIAQYSLRLISEGTVPVRAVQLQEVMVQPWTAKGVIKAPHGGTYRTYLATLRRLRVLDVPPVSVTTLLPYTPVQITMRAVPTSRGMAVFGALYVVVTGVLGLVQVRKPVQVDTDTQTVLPKQIQVDFPPPDGKRTLHVGGIPLANQVGDSEEFRSLRDYRPGDPLRSIHWRSFARTGKPLVREFQQEYFSRHALVLDTACEAHQAESFEASVSVAAWIASRPIEADALLDLMFVGDRVHRLSIGRSLGTADTFLRVLATVTPTSLDGMEALMKSLSQNAGQISSAVVILQHWDEPRKNAISELMANGLRPTVLLIGDPPSSPIGLETGPEWQGVLHWVPLPPRSTSGRQG